MCLTILDPVEPQVSGICNIEPMCFVNVKYERKTNMFVGKHCKHQKNIYYKHNIWLVSKVWSGVKNEKLGVWSYFEICLYVVTKTNCVFVTILDSALSLIFLWNNEYDQNLVKPRRVCQPIRFHTLVNFFFITHAPCACLSDKEWSWSCFLSCLT